MTRGLVLCLLVATAAQAKNAPSFRGDLMGGRKTSLDACLKKDRLLLLSFWATWCLPCLEELTHVKAKLEKDPTLPLDVLTVNVDRESSEVASTMRQMGIDFPVILDPTGEIFGKYQKAGTLPYSVLIAPDRTIEAEFSGYHPSMLEKVRESASKHGQSAVQ